MNPVHRNQGYRFSLRTVMVVFVCIGIVCWLAASFSRVKTGDEFTAVVEGTRDELDSVLDRWLTKRGFERLEQPPSSLAVWFGEDGKPIESAYVGRFHDSQTFYVFMLIRPTMFVNGKPVDSPVEVQLRTHYMQNLMPWQKTTERQKVSRFVTTFGAWLEANGWSAAQAAAIDSRIDPA